MLRRWRKSSARLRPAPEPAQFPEKPAGSEEIPFPPPFHVIPPPRPLPAERLESLFRGDYPAQDQRDPAGHERVRAVAAHRGAVRRRRCRRTARSSSSTTARRTVARISWLEGAREDVHLIRTDRAPGRVRRAQSRAGRGARRDRGLCRRAHRRARATGGSPSSARSTCRTWEWPRPGIGVMGKPNAAAACGQRIAETKLRLEWLPVQGDGALSRADAGRRLHGHAPRNPEAGRGLRRGHAAMGLGGRGAVPALLAAGV